MQCGVHLFLGLSLCRFLIPTRANNGPLMGVVRYGVVLGAILPDIDLPIAALAVALTQDPDAADIYHRTFTHCLFFLALIAVLFYGRRRYINNAVKTNSDLSFLAISSPGKGPTLLFESTYFGTGLLIGILSHIVADMLYMKGVAVFWPFSLSFYGHPPFGHWTNMSELSVKLIEVTDHFTDILLFIGPLLMNHKRYRLDPKIYTAALKYCFVKGIIVSVLTALAFYEGIAFFTYFTLLYIPGTVFFVISVLLPVVFRDALPYVGDSTSI